MLNRKYEGSGVPTKVKRNTATARRELEEEKNTFQVRRDSLSDFKTFSSYSVWLFPFTDCVFRILLLSRVRASQRNCPYCSFISPEFQFVWKSFKEFQKKMYPNQLFLRRKQSLFGKGVTHFRCNHEERKLLRREVRTFSTPCNLIEECTVSIGIFDLRLEKNKTIRVIHTVKEFCV